MELFREKSANNNPVAEKKVAETEGTEKKEKSWRGERALKMSYQERKDYESIEEDIAKLEEELN